MSYITVSVTPLINQISSSNDFMVLIISFISSFDMNKVNHFPAITGSFPLIFILNSFIEFKAKLLTSSSNLSLAKRIARSASIFSPKLPKILPKTQTFFLFIFNIIFVFFFAREFTLLV